MKKNVFFLSVFLFTIFCTACKTEVIISTDDNSKACGTLEGKAFFANAQDNSKIQIILDKADGRSANLKTPNAPVQVPSKNSRSVVSYINCNQDGTFRIENLQEGVYTIYAACLNSKERAVSQLITITKNTTTTIPDLKLTATGSLKGKITVDSSPDENAGFLVSVSGTSYMATTDDDGSFVISDIPAATNYKLTIIHGTFTCTWKTGLTVNAFEETDVGEHNFDSSVTPEVLGNGMTFQTVINYELNGGYFSSPYSKIYTLGIGDEVVLPEPKRSNYYFWGWHYKSDFSDEEITCLSDSNFIIGGTLYAEWLFILEEHKSLLISNIQEIIQTGNLTLAGNFDVSIWTSIRTCLMIIHRLNPEVKININLNGVTGITSIPEEAFQNVENLGSMFLPEGVTSINKTAFYGCTSLTEITLPNSVSSIGYSAFSGCSSLTEISIPDGVTSINNFVFYNCSNLTEITIPDSVTSIGDCAFAGCTSLTEITIPDSVTSIGNCTFEGCTSLTEIIIPDSVTSKGYGIFDGCSSLHVTIICHPELFVRLFKHSNFNITKIIIPDGVTSIKKNTFYDCTSLTEIIIPDSVTSIGDCAFKGCTSLTKIAIPDSVSSLGDFAFEGCTSLIKINIPNGVTSIGYYAFSGCTSLTEITIPNGVTSIGYYAFSGCTCLTKIAIPDSVSSIGDFAFKDCTNLTKITIPDSVTYLGDEVFDGCSSLHITITYNPELYNELLSIKTKISEIIIPDSVTSIGFATFEGYTSLTEIIIPDSVTSIGNNAFSNCSSLTEIVIPDSVTSIGFSAFSGCSSLTELTIPRSVTSIGYYAFQDCFSLTEINIPDSVTSIGYMVFAGCSSLTEITIPDSITFIDNFAFEGCSGLTKITIQNGVNFISAYAFRNCINLESVIFENPQGWYVREFDTGEWSYSDIYIRLFASDLSNPEIAAKYLTDDYAGYGWERY